MNDILRRIIEDPYSLEVTCDQFRKAGHQIIVTTGVFDLLHPGHFEYLLQAKEIGGKLLVGIDSDERAGHFKPGRPILEQRARMLNLAHCRHVDRVFSLEGVNDELILRLKPDFLVISETTATHAERVKNLEGRTNGTKIVLLPCVSKDHSTTAIIARAVKAYAASQRK